MEQHSFVIDHTGQGQLSGTGLEAKHFHQGGPGGNFFPLSTFFLQQQNFALAGFKIFGKGFKWQSSIRPKMHFARLKKNLWSVMKLFLKDISPTWYLQFHSYLLKSLKNHGR